MKRVELPLAELTTAEKLDLLEMIWSDLDRGEESVASPAWHAGLLAERKALLDSGAAKVSDWEQAKDRIKKKVQ